MEYSLYPGVPTFFSPLNAGTAGYKTNSPPPPPFIRLHEDKAKEKRKNPLMQPNKVGPGNEATAEVPYPF